MNRETAYACAGLALSSVPALNNHKENNVAKPTKIKARAAERVPQNKDEAVAYIKMIGDLQRERQRLRNDMDDRITAIREECQRLLTPIEDEITSISSGVHTWAEANRDRLTNNGRVKTANMLTGELRWRTTPPACKLVRTKEAIEEIKSRGLAHLFIRTKEDVNKEAILARQDLIEGCKFIEITQTEEFVIVPFETELEEVA
jgi:phage host-nuclease inhibitor protein Gam